MTRARIAARHRDAVTLGLAERGLRLLRRGRTAGEELLVRSWRDAGSRALLSGLSGLADDLPTPDVVRLRLIGLLVISPAAEPD
jgi:hypothetical protein